MSLQSTAVDTLNIVFKVNAAIAPQSKIAVELVFNVNATIRFAIVDRRVVAIVNRRFFAIVDHRLVTIVDRRLAFCVFSILAVALQK